MTSPENQSLDDWPQPTFSGCMTPMANDDLSLNQLNADERAQVLELTSEPQLNERLMELGILPGEVVTVWRRGLFAGPIFVEVNQTQIALREAEAACVRIKKL